MASVSQLIVSSWDGKFSEFLTPRVSTELDLPPAPSLCRREPTSPLSSLRTDWMATPFTSEQVEWLQTTFGGTPTPPAGTSGTTASPPGSRRLQRPHAERRHYRHERRDRSCGPPTQTVRYVPATVVREGVLCVFNTVSYAGGQLACLGTNLTPSRTHVMYTMYIHVHVYCIDTHILARTKARAR